MTWRYPTLRVGQLTQTTETFTLYDDGSPNYDERTVGLTDAESVTISLDHRNLAITPVNAGVCEITDAEAGEVEYTFSAAETSIYGEYFVQFEVTWADGSVELVPPDGYESVMAIGRRQPHGPMPMTVSTLEANEVNVGGGGLTGLSTEAITWMTGAGLGVDETSGELNVTAAFDGITGLTNPLTSSLNADNFPIRTLPAPQNPDEPARKAEHDENTAAIESNTTSIESNTTTIGEHTTSISTLETDKAGRDGDTLNPAILNNARVIAPSIERAFNTLKAAHDDLPAEGGTIHLAETTNPESSDFTISKPLRIVGQGFPFSQNATAYIDMGGNTLHATERAQTWEKLQVVNGNVIIGEHNAYGGRHHIELCVRESPGTSIEFRGGFMDGDFHIKSNASQGKGIVWNLSADGVDYFNQNVVNLMVHSSTGTAVEITGIGTGTSEFHGNNFVNFEVENTTATGFRVDNSVWLFSNRFEGYGVHDGGVDVQPAQYGGNVIWWSELRGGGTLNIGGTVHARQPHYLRNIAVDNNTELKLTGQTRIMPGGNETRMGRWSHPDYGHAGNTIQAHRVTTTPVDLGTIERSASLTIHGEDSADGTISFVDRVDAIAFGATTVVSSTTRNAPSGRNYTTNANGNLEMSMVAGSYEIHVEKFLSEQK